VIIEKQAPADQDPALELSLFGTFSENLACGGNSNISAGSARVCTYEVPGTYRVTESAPSTNGRFLSLRCDDNNSTTDPATRTATIRLEADETVRCTWLNAAPSGQDAATNVTLTDELPAGPDLTWSLDPSLTGCSIDGRLLSCSFGSLASGETVSVHVRSPTTTASCGSYTNTAAARADNRTAVQASASVTVGCQRGRVQVVKTVGRAAPSGSQSFCFEFRAGASTTSAGTILESQCATAGNGGVINFATALVPGTTYALCEIVMPGWMTTLVPPVYVVYNPSGDNSTVCTDFAATTPGATRIFAIDNKPPPGGLGRTIGFWKNWASCAGSNGKQRPVLDQTLAAADPAGITIGMLTLHAGDCLQAVRLLDKSTIDTGKKMASDPAFALAAQLLAAKLNVVAGAGSCPAAVTAINDAQTFLAAVHFNGITHDELSAAQATQANSLATTIDRYNNNLLC
jgi:Domain of unknown function DUF11